MKRQGKYNGRTAGDWFYLWQEDKVRADTYEAGVRQLKAELLKMLPRSSDTMSAMRQRDITDFVVKRIDHLLPSPTTQLTDDAEKWDDRY